MSGTAGVPARAGFAGFAERPGLIVVTNNARDTIAGAAYGTLALSATEVADGWSRSGNVLTCGRPGTYELSIEIQQQCKNGGAAGVGFLAYRKNGGTEVPYEYLNYATIGLVASRFRLYLSCTRGMTLDFRAKGATAGDQIDVFGDQAVSRYALKQVSTWY